MGAYKVLITFLAKEIMEGVLKEDEDLLRKFLVEVRPWSEEEVCQAKRVRVEYYGIPLQAWSSATIRKMSEQCVTVV